MENKAEKKPTKITDMLTQEQKVKYEDTLTMIFAQLGEDVGIEEVKFYEVKVAEMILSGEIK